MRGLTVVLVLTLAACGGDDRQAVTITEADAEAPPPPPTRSRVAPLDTVYADSGLFVDPSLRVDSLRADSLRRDSLRLDSIASAAPAVPDFRTFWPTFIAAIRQDRAAVAALAAFSDEMPQENFETTLYEAAFVDDAFRDGILALTPRDFEREGTARSAWVIVGYAVDGEIVPEDEADTESGVQLRFDVVDGAYRLVGISLAG